jgi:hypothetical protein
MSKRQKIRKKLAQFYEEHLERWLLGAQVLVIVVASAAWNVIKAIANAIWQPMRASALFIWDLWGSFEARHIMGNFYFALAFILQYLLLSYDGPFGLQIIADQLDISAWLILFVFLISGVALNSDMKMLPDWMRSLMHVLALVPALAYSMSLVFGFASGTFTSSVLLPLSYLILAILLTMVGLRLEFEKRALLRTVRVTERRMAEVQMQYKRLFEQARVKDGSSER